MENPFDENRMQRPKMLVVLCILTFIGSGWNVLSNLFSLFASNTASMNIQMQQYSSMAGQLEEQGASAFWNGFLNSSLEMLQATMLHAQEIHICNLVLYVVSLLGAILMYQLRRMGFYLYTTAQILLLFVLPYFVGFSTVVVIGMFFSGALALVFIILYALNLKYMNR